MRHVRQCVDPLDISTRHVNLITNITMSTGSVYDKWVKALLEGAEGSDVIAMMRKHYTRQAKNNGEEQLNECTLRTKVSDVKKMFLLSEASSNQRNTHMEYEKGVQRLIKASKGAHKNSKDAVNRFLKLPLDQQAKEIRYEDGLGTGHEAIDAAFSSIKVLPDTLESFRVDPKENESCKRDASARLLRKKKFEVPSLQQVLEHTLNVLKEPEKNPNMTIAALLVASGRRTTEMMNGTSKFSRLEGHAHGCHFCGQLKARRHVKTMTFKIPLLVEFTKFKKAFDFIRKWQGDVKHLSNKQISTRYQPNLQRHLKTHKFGGLDANPHLFRAIYMRAVLLMYDWGSHRDKRIAKYCLGHAEGTTSDHYDHVVVVDSKQHKNVLGAFPMTEEELVEIEEIVDG